MAANFESDADLKQPAEKQSAADCNEMKGRETGSRQ